MISARATSSNYAIPSIGYRLADKAICENGTDAKDKIDYENHVAYFAEYFCWKDADVEEDDGGANECDGGDPYDWAHELALTMHLSAQGLEGKEKDRTFSEKMIAFVISS